MKKILVLFVLAIAACGEFVDDSRAVKAMEANGFTQVRVTGQHGMAPQWNGCSKSDAVAFDVQGINQQQKQIYATVCCGLILKSCTIRF